MKNTQRITLLAAVLVALATGWMMYNYVARINAANAVANATPRVVVVAAREISPRTPITADMLATVTIPGGAVDANAVLEKDRDTVLGKLSLITIPAHSQITTDKIGNVDQFALPVRLQPGKRAVSIQIDKVKGISGLLTPGDRVDIIAIPPRAGEGVPPARTILRGIRVLAVGNMLETTTATPPPDMINSTTITLELTPKQADLIAMADANTVLRLALRSPKEPINSYPAETLNFGTTTTTANVPPPAPQQQVAQAPVAAAPAPVTIPVRPNSVQGNIMIVDGDRITYASTGNGQ